MTVYLTYILKRIENRYSDKYLYTIFISALFTTAKRWKQPNCPSWDEWINKLSHNYMMEYYSAIKRDEVLVPAAT